MILVKRGTALFFYLLFTFGIISVGIYAYIALGGGTPGQDPELKTAAESILFISLAGAAVILTAFLIVIRRTVSLFRELDKMIELNKRGDFSPELSMKKLGSIGERITLLYFTLNSLNERKTLKISALSGLADFLVDNIDIALLATDVQGYIRYVSRSFSERTERQRSDLISKNVDQIFPEVPFRDLVVELDRINSSLELKELKTPLTLVGIRDRRNELSYVIWLFEGAVRMSESAVVPDRNGVSRGRLRKVFKRRRQ